MKRIRIFGERELGDFLESRKVNIASSIESESDDYILNVNEDDYIAHKVSEATVENLQINVADIYASSSERMIPAEHFPNSFHVHPGKSYKKNVIKFHVPVSGDIQLLYCVPSNRILWSMDVEVGHNEFCFEIINFRDDASEIVRRKDENIQSILQQYKNVIAEVDRSNASLEKYVRNIFNSRKQRIQKSSGVLASLGVPVKKISLDTRNILHSTLTKTKKTYFK